MKIRNALRDMQLRLTELEEYLNISRPTLYKFVEYYENNNEQLINPIVKDLFDYISQNKEITKKEVVSYIANIGKEEDSKKTISFSVEPSEKQQEFLELVKTYINGTYDQNNFSNELGKLLLMVDDLNNRRELVEEEKENIKKIIKGENKK
jgi:hypothetical protein